MVFFHPFLNSNPINLMQLLSDNRSKFGALVVVFFSKNFFFIISFFPTFFLLFFFEEIGIFLTSFGSLFLLFGMLLLGDRALLALGNVSFCCLVHSYFCPVCVMRVMCMCAWCCVCVLVLMWGVCSVGVWMMFC